MTKLTAQRSGYAGTRTHVSDLEADLLATTSCYLLIGGAQAFRQKGTPDIISQVGVDGQKIQGR